MNTCIRRLRYNIITTIIILFTLPKMSFSSRRRNYFLIPHRRDGLIEWMKSMLMHSFVLDALATTGPDTFSHFEELINEHREMCVAASATDTNGEEENNQSNNGRGGSGSSCFLVEPRQSRLKKVVPTVGIFHTPLPLRKAYEAYNTKYRLDKRRHLSISFNEIRHIMNLAQIMAMTAKKTETNKKKNISTGIDYDSDNDDNDDDDDVYNNAVRQWSQDSPALIALNNKNNNNNEGNSINKIPELSLDGGEELGPEGDDDNNDSSSPSFSSSFNGPSLITFDGDQTLYSDGKNFESNPKLASYIYLLLKKGVSVAVVTAAGYEYQTSKYELRLSGLLQFFQQQKYPLTEEQLNHFYLFGGECNYLLRLGCDYKLHPVSEHGPNGWMTSTKNDVGYYDSPANWEESTITQLLDLAESSLKSSIVDQNLRNARFIRKKRSCGIVPASSSEAAIPREALDETVLRVQDDLEQSMLLRNTATTGDGTGDCGTGTTVGSALLSSLPYCAFNGGRDVWVDVGNKRVGVQILQSYLNIPATETLHIGDQFLNTGNDYAARSCCPCVWITSPDETTYVLKSILRLALGVQTLPTTTTTDDDDDIISTPTTTIETASLPSNNNKESTSSNSVVDFAELERRANAVATMDVFTGEMITNNSSTHDTSSSSSSSQKNISN